MSHQFTAKVDKKGERHNGITTKKVIIMQKQEFIDLCKQHNPAFGSHLSDEVYRKYEVLYDELEDMDKQRFCELVMTDPVQLLAEAAKEINYWHGRAEYLEEENEMLTRALIDNDDYETLAKVYDTKTIIGCKLEEGASLTSEERDYIKRNLK